MKPKAGDYDDKMRKALFRAEWKAHKLQIQMDELFTGKVVQLRVSMREWHGGSRHPAGRRFVVYCVQMSGRSQPNLWLRRADRTGPSMGVTPDQVEFIKT